MKKECNLSGFFIFRKAVALKLNKVDKCSVGGRIREQRRKLGWSLDNLAFELNTSKALISQYENGITKVPGKRINQIAGLLGTSAGYLLNGEIVHQNADNRIVQMNFWFEGLDNEMDRQFIYEQMRNSVEWIRKNRGTQR